MANVLHSLQLEQFRSYVAFKLDLIAPVTVIVGPNALGKTSILEAANLLATGNSFRAEKVEEMVRFGAELGRVVGRTDEDELELMLTRGLVQGKRTQHRLYSVNQVRRRRQDFTGKFYSVVFRPEDLRLVEGSPSRRRSFLDAPLALTNQEYARSLTTYEQALVRRNKLLQAVKDREQPASVLTYWNMTLIKHGQVVTEARRQFLSTYAGLDFPIPFSVEYQPSLISEERIAEYQPREIAAGHTLIGPHKDDIQVQLPFAWAGGELQPIESYGSRGQQRLAVLWLKLGEYAYLLKHAGQPPLLLLDDILSELDVDSRAHVMSLLGKGQVIVTTTEASLATDIAQEVSQVEVIDLLAHVGSSTHPDPLITQTLF